jgi:hypothetical protein
VHWRKKEKKRDGIMPFIIRDPPETPHRSLHAGEGWTTEQIGSILTNLCF